MSGRSGWDCDRGCGLMDNLQHALHSGGRPSARRCYAGVSSGISMSRHRGRAFQSESVSTESVDAGPLENANHQ